MSSLDLTFPRVVTAIHQIEISSRCSLACKYCPNATMPRPKQDMTLDTYTRTLERVRYYAERGTQTELNLAGLGESTLHPDFPKYIRLAREAVGYGIKLIFATNGLQYTDDIVAAAKECGVAVWVTLHNPTKATKAVLAYRKAGVLENISTDPAVNPMNWAGQVDWPVFDEEPLFCPWLRYGWTVALSDGRITTCCIDASGAGVVGHVNDPDGLKVKPYELCSKCNQRIDVTGYNQYA